MIAQVSFTSLVTIHPGKDTVPIDPVARKISYKYDDLLEIHQTTNRADELLSKYTYRNNHLPLTAIDAKIFHLPYLLKAGCCRMLWIFIFLLCFFGDCKTY